jgi:imidazolonepropionase
MNLVVKNIGILAQVREHPETMVRGTGMAELPCLNDAWLYVENGRFHSWGSMSHFNESMKELDPSGIAATTDAREGIVSPNWCDSHTHIVFAATREQEFVDRIHGLTYEEIARRGGGILNSARKMADAGEEKLFEDAWGRLQEMAACGTGSVEIKSGYGLSYDAEMKMLRVIAKLKEKSPLNIKATFLGAHALPAEFKNNRVEYIRLMTGRMLPDIAANGLADFCDVFCDHGFFTPDETETILEAAWKFGIPPKIHANELGHSGGIGAGVRNKARSVDHLEYTSDEDIRLLLASSTMPTLLPSTAFFLKLKYAPARKMIDSGLPVALASDYNPGSSPSGNMPFVISLACIQMNMTPEEAINAATINSAYAMDVQDKAGVISKNRNADFFITEPLPSLANIPYSFGRNRIIACFAGGRQLI